MDYNPCEASHLLVKLGFSRRLFVPITKLIESNCQYFWIGAVMTAKIYKPSKTAMQLGRKTKISRGCEWVLAYMRKSAAKPDQLMGWQSSSDTARQVKMYFPDLESAVAYAEANDIDYVVQQPKSRRVKPRAYADNFAFTRNGAWTH